MTDEELNSLEARAKAATPGFRTARRRAWDWAVDSPIGLVCGVFGSKKQNNMEADAQFIAEASPEAILELITEFRKLRGWDDWDAYAKSHVSGDSRQNGEKP